MLLVVLIGGFILWPSSEDKVAPTPNEAVAEQEQGPRSPSSLSPMPAATITQSPGRASKELDLGHLLVVETCGSRRSRHYSLRTGLLDFIHHDLTKVRNLPQIVGFFHPVPYLLSVRRVVVTVMDDQSASSHLIG